MLNNSEYKDIHNLEGDVDKNVKYKLRLYYFCLSQDDEHDAITDMMISGLE